MALTGYTPFVHLDLTYKLTNYPSHTPLSDDRGVGAATEQQGRDDHDQHNRKETSRRTFCVFLGEMPW
jgi:hypothetical protein